MAFYWNETGHLLVRAPGHAQGGGQSDPELMEAFGQMTRALDAMAQAWGHQITTPGFWAYGELDNIIERSGPFNPTTISKDFSQAAGNGADLARVIVSQCLDVPVADLGGVDLRSLLALHMRVQGDPPDNAALGLLSFMIGRIFGMISVQATLVTLPADVLRAAIAAEPCAATKTVRTDLPLTCQRFDFALDAMVREHPVALHYAGQHDEAAAKRLAAAFT